MALVHLDGLRLLEHQQRVELGGDLLAVATRDGALETHLVVLAKQLAEVGKHLVTAFVPPLLLQLLVTLVPRLWWRQGGAREC